MSPKKATKTKNKQKNKRPPDKLSEPKSSKEENYENKAKVTKITKIEDSKNLNFELNEQQSQLNSQIKNDQNDENMIESIYQYRKSRELKQQNPFSIKKEQRSEIQNSNQIQQLDYSESQNSNQIQKSEQQNFENQNVIKDTDQDLVDSQKNLEKNIKKKQKVKQKQHEEIIDENKKEIRIDIKDQLDGQEQLEQFIEKIENCGNQSINSIFLKNEAPNQENALTILNNNINGIGQNSYKVNNLIAITQKQMNITPDIITLQETGRNINNAELQNYKIFNYIDNPQELQGGIFKSSTTSVQKGKGLATLIKKDLFIMEQCSQFCLQNKILTIKLIKKEQGRNNIMSFIINVHVTPKEEAQTIKNKLKFFIIRIESFYKNCNIIVCGDFNCYQDSLEKLNLQICNNEILFTRFKKDPFIFKKAEGTKIDFILTNSKDLQQKSFTSLIIMASRSEQLNVDNKIYSDHIAMLTQFETDIMNQEFQNNRISFLQKGKIMQCIESWRDKQQFDRRKDILNGDLKWMINLRDKCIKPFKTHQIEQQVKYFNKQANYKEDWIAQYKESYDQLVNKQKHQIMKSLMRHKQETCIVEKVILENNEEIQGKELNDLLHEEQTKRHHLIQSGPLKIKASKLKCTIRYDEYLKAIQFLDDKKAIGNDALLSQTIKKIGVNYFYVLLNKLTNQELSEEYKKFLTQSKLIYLSKIRNQETVRLDQIRTIAVQPIFIRIIENIVYGNINFDYIKGYFVPNQHGFLPERSQMQPLELMHEFIERKKKQKQNAYVATLDIQKAYDMVDHNILMQQLFYIYGQNIINQEMLTQLLFLLCNYRIGSNNQNSQNQTTQIQIGVPQGSKIAPLLFNMYINKAIRKTNLFINKTNARQKSEMKLIAYADDVAILSDNYITLRNTIQYFKKQLSRLNLQLNEKKSEIIAQVISDSREIYISKEKHILNPFVKVNKIINQSIVSLEQWNIDQIKEKVNNQAKNYLKQSQASGYYKYLLGMDEDKNNRKKISQAYNSLSTKMENKTIVDELLHEHYNNLLIIKNPEIQQKLDYLVQNGTDKMQQFAKQLKNSNNILTIKIRRELTQKEKDLPIDLDATNIYRYLKSDNPNQQGITQNQNLKELFEKIYKQTQVTFQQYVQKQLDDLEEKIETNIELKKEEEQFKYLREYQIYSQNIIKYEKEKKQILNNIKRKQIQMTTFLNVIINKNIIESREQDIKITGNQIIKLLSTNQIELKQQSKYLGHTISFEKKNPQITKINEMFTNQFQWAQRLQHLKWQYQLIAINSRIVGKLRYQFYGIQFCANQELIEEWEQRLQEIYSRVFGIVYSKENNFEQAQILKNMCNLPSIQNLINYKSSQQQLKQSTSVIKSMEPNQIENLIQILKYNQEFKKFRFNLKAICPYCENNTTSFINHIKKCKQMPQIAESLVDIKNMINSERRNIIIDKKQNQRIKCQFQREIINEEINKIAQNYQQCLDFAQNQFVNDQSEDLNSLIKEISRLESIKNTAISYINQLQKQRINQGQNLIDYNEFADMIYNEREELNELQDRNKNLRNQLRNVYPKMFTIGTESIDKEIQKTNRKILENESLLKKISVRMNKISKSEQLIKTIKDGKLFQEILNRSKFINLVQERKNGPEIEQEINRRKEEQNNNAIPSQVNKIKAEKKPNPNQILSLEIKHNHPLMQNLIIQKRCNMQNSKLERAMVIKYKNNEDEETQDSELEISMDEEEKENQKRLRDIQRRVIENF